MRFGSWIRVVALTLLMAVVAMPVLQAASVEEKRQSVRNMADETLTRLYKVHPSARGAVENSAAYAVFSNYGIKLFVFGGGRGKGMAVNNQTGEEIFMKMVQVEAGFGLGVKNFSMVFVFDNQKAFQRFVDNDGWELGGQATAAATDGVNGGSMQGAISLWPGAWVYQMTDKGLAIEITGKGTRFYKDSELN